MLNLEPFKEYDYMTFDARKFPNGDGALIGRTNEYTIAIGADVGEVYKGDSIDEPIFSFDTTAYGSAQEVKEVCLAFVEVLLGYNEPCPHCGEDPKLYYGDDNPYCRACDEDVTKPPTEKEVDVRVSTDESKCYVCPCGAAFEPDGRTICPFCEGDPYDDGNIEKIDYTKIGVI